jgi:hypothetical protein
MVVNVHSERQVDQVVDVAPERIRIHPRNVFTATNEFSRATAGSGQGRSSGTGAPSGVTTMRSPCATRRMTSPPLFRGSRTGTASIKATCVTGVTIANGHVAFAAHR